MDNLESKREDGSYTIQGVKIKGKTEAVRTTVNQTKLSTNHH